jgi:hypothetical protein
MSKDLVVVKLILLLGVLSMSSAALELHSRNASNGIDQKLEDLYGRIRAMLSNGIFARQTLAGRNHFA